MVPAGESLWGTNRDLNKIYLGNDGDHIDFDEEVTQDGTDGGPGRVRGYDVLFVAGVEAGEVPFGVAQVDCGLEHVGEVEPMGAENLPQVLHRLDGLFFDSGPHHLARDGVTRRLPGGVEKSVGSDCLGVGAGRAGC